MPLKGFVWRLAHGGWTELRIWVMEATKIKCHSHYMYQVNGLSTWLLVVDADLDCWLGSSLPGLRTVKTLPLLSPWCSLEGRALSPHLRSGKLYSTSLRVKSLRKLSWIFSAQNNQHKPDYVKLWLKCSDFPAFWTYNPHSPHDHDPTSPSRHFQWSVWTALCNLTLLLTLGRLPGSAWSTPSPLWRHPLPLFPPHGHAGPPWVPPRCQVHFHLKAFVLAVPSYFFILVFNYSRHPMLFYLVSGAQHSD